MDKIRALKYFSAVAKLGSFTAAAKRYAVPPSSLSRRVADLEDSLGATLLKRSTRVVQLTEVGRQYLEQVDDILQQLELSDEAVRSYQAKPMGRLRISAMPGFGERLLIPLLDEFSALYPQVTLDIELSDAVTQLGRDEVDIAIRGGYAPDERIQAIRLMSNEFIPVAAPSYLKKMGRPRSALDLKTHQALFYRTPAGPSPWLCEIKGEWRDVSGAAVAISNHGRWLAQLAIEGKGIVLGPRWSLRGYLEDGSLEELHLDPPVRVTQNPTMEIILLYQKQRYAIPKVKAAVDFFVARLRDK